MSDFEMPKSLPDVEESITVEVDGHVCLLEFRRYGDLDDPFPLYDIDFTFDGGCIDLIHPRWWKNRPLPEPLTKFGVGKLLRIVMAILKAIDTWGKRHPHTFITTSEYGLATLCRSLKGKGIICSGRFEQWLGFYDELGHRVLFIGMLNLIEDKFAVNDLWRVAKDTRKYYLGDYYSPVDWLKDAIRSSNDPNIQLLF
jgi:hypothetical protein